MKNPRDLGFLMPAETRQHSCCWMAWPCRRGLWPDRSATEMAYAEVANTIARFEPVKMLVAPHTLDSAQHLLGDNVELMMMPIDDSWTRDSGPNFLINDAGELSASTWQFNAWGGKYSPFDQDALMGWRICETLGIEPFVSSLTAEGGGVTVDGEGTVITTESCFLNRNRNPGWSRDEISAELCRTLGAEKVIWIPGDPEETETDGHVDGIAAFIEPGRVLVEINSDKSDPHFAVGERNRKALQGQTDARGRRLELEFIEEGHYHSNVWNGGCSSYVNSYFANGAVIVPGYGYDRDAQAVEVYESLFPDREVVQVQINAIAIGGGGVHCITQQQPVAHGVFD